MPFDMSLGWMTQPWPHGPSAGSPSLRGAGVSPPPLEARKLTTISWLWDCRLLPWGQNRVKHRQAGSQTTEAQVRSSLWTWQLAVSLSQQKETQTHSKMALKDRICMTMVTCHWVLFQSSGVFTSEERCKGTFTSVYSRTVEYRSLNHLSGSQWAWCPIFWSLLACIWQPGGLVWGAGAIFQSPWRSCRDVHGIVPLWDQAH